MSATSIMVAWLLAAPVDPAAQVPRAPVSAEPSVAAPGIAEPVPQGARPLVIAASGLSIADLRSALHLRLPERDLIDPAAPRPAPSDFVDVIARDDGTVSYTLITAEGRAYDRDMPADADTVRALASAIANLTFAIEAGTIEPDRIDVPQPVPAPEASVPEASVPEVPVPEVPVPEVPVPEVPVPADPVPVPPTWELGPSIDGGIILGLAPTLAAGSLGAGHGRLGLDARHRRGALIGGGLRLASRSADGLSMVRLRIDVGGGWAWRWRRFELLASASVTVEPWWVRRDGVTTPLQLGTTDAARRPLLGAFARISPGARFPLGRGASTWMRIGPRVELGGSFVPQAGARTVDIATADPSGTRSTLRLGGLELVAGLELALWFDATVGR